MCTNVARDICCALAISSPSYCLGHEVALRGMKFNAELRVNVFRTCGSSWCPISRPI